MMAEYRWPAQGSAALIGKDHDRIDGIEKTTGAAKYAYDQVLDKMLFAKLLGCPHAHCRVLKIDTSAAEKVPGVVHIAVMKKWQDDKGNALVPEVRWQGDHLACVAAESEAAAALGVAAIEVEYEMLDVFVKEEDLEAAQAAERTEEGRPDVQLAVEPGDEVDEDEFADQEFSRLFKEAAVVVEGEYGIQAITHMCLEPHGSTLYWDDDKLIVYHSTQNVSGAGANFAEILGITRGDVEIRCDFVGGGFGSKFAADPWSATAAEISKATGRPVKMMLDRELELKIAGNRPSGFIKVKLGADQEGVVTVWDSVHWGTGGAKGGGVSKDNFPYVFNPPNRRRKQIGIVTNADPDRAWRAPNHPQACAITQTAYDDIAAKLGIDSYDVFFRNLDTVSPKKAGVSMAGTYREQMEIAAKLIDWKAKWHPHGKGEADGSIVTGLGMALHTWGGGGHPSKCTIKVHPDGGVETFLGSQDIGTGTRTAIGMVVAETFGLPLSAVKVHIGSSKYPESGPSGGSTTIGGVSESNRRASQDALQQLMALAAKKLKVEPDTLEAKGGRIQVKDDPETGLNWKDACSLLKMKTLEVQGTYVRGKEESRLSGIQVGGVQMAEVAVDRETGVIKMKKFVAVQDMGLIVNPKSARSQIYGAVIMGIAYSLFEERIMDANTGAFLNCELTDYKLPRLGDIGEIVVHLHEPASEYDRGVVGLGEPPVISPGAAISNAVANALGVRVPVLPLTPKRVLDAIEKGANT
ncbi:MAG TPA: xanthine dehydrogenase family protein molybdopterin-binding subunit [Pirellulales bacterium]|nr:xanthine dehydrogenase family protein molybdopterin-binding subunit [Pirellulales bacterium]